MTKRDLPNFGNTLLSKMARKRIISTKMSKRLSFYVLVGLTSLCIFFLLINRRYSSYVENRMQPVLSEVDMQPRAAKHEDHYVVIAGKVNMTVREIQEVIDQQRVAIERDMEDYQYPSGINISNFNELVMERGGRPLRSVVVTSWRSGSTFVGDVINAHPANFYHYEPLVDFGIVQVRELPLSQLAIANLYALFNCEYHKLKNYLNFGKEHTWLFSHNPRLWQQCVSHKKICWEPQFLSKFCQIFPFQSMKIVRMRLNVAKALLEDKSLGVRMVLLVRDPRGVLQSRKHRDWCPGSPDCFDPARVCADMVSDYEAAVKLKQKYPRYFKIMRYEDLSLDPYANAKDLYKFYGLYFHENVKIFLDSHTKRDLGGVSSTFRNSKVAPFHWRNDLEFEEVEEIQSVCSAAMKLWGYVLALNETHQKTFKPIIDYSLEL